MRDTFQVMQACCDECLFSPDRIVPGSRMKEIVSNCLKNDTFFICHKATLAGKQEVCCRAFFDTFGRDVLIIRAARMFDMVEFVSEESLEEKEKEE